MYCYKLITSFHFSYPLIFSFIPPILNSLFVYLLIASYKEGFNLKKIFIN